jgi:hypothetical protein
MGTITRSFANNLTTGGVLKADAFNDASLNNVTALNVAIATGNMILLSSQTASNFCINKSFTTGIDSTYKEYQFWFVNMHPATNGVEFQFNMSTDGGSSYNVAKTTTTFEASQNEAGSSTNLTYQAGDDLAQGTGFQELSDGIGNENDECNAGTLTLFNPSSTTYVKHFIATTNMYNGGDFSVNDFTAGYGNTTSAVNAIQFKMSSGNIDEGTILMYGIN